MTSYILSNGTPVVIAEDRKVASYMLGCHAQDVFLVDELSPKDRHEDLVEAVATRSLYGFAC